ncbi:MAG: AraC family transcriptional regulator [Lachnospiraceae bacterium]|nr:AraC family transcriptional regulator [Lachnospiraceae bacterium]
MQETSAPCGIPGGIARMQVLYDFARIPLVLVSMKDAPTVTASVGLSSFAPLLREHFAHIASFLKDSSYDLLYQGNEVYGLIALQPEDPISKKVLICGPALISEAFSFQQLRDLSFASGMTQKDLMEMAGQLPIVTAASFTAFFRMLLFEIRSMDPSASRETSLNDPLSPLPSLEELRDYRFLSEKDGSRSALSRMLLENREEERLHTSYREEVALLSCVRDGDLTRLEATYRSQPQVQYGQMSAHPMRQLFYGSIANTTLVTRYAIEGGMDEEEAFTLSDIYIRKMEQCSSLYQLETLNEEMALDFTTRVAEKKRAGLPYSPAICSCMDYIKDHRYEKISLSDLARHTALSEKYLSFLFVREVGETISSYILARKIEEAKNLLRYTDDPYSSIAALLSFSSQSHFTARFRTVTGMTPRAFRNSFANAHPSSYDESMDFSGNPTQ